MPCSAWHSLIGMLRTKLLIAFLALLAPSVAMGALLYWAPRQVEQRLDRSLLAHGEVQLYLALQTYRDLQRLSHEVMLGGAASEAEVLVSRRRLGEQLAALRELTLEELAFVGLTEPEERSELARIGRFEQLFDAWAAALGESGSADPGEFRGRIDLLDQELGELIDEVIADETGEAAAADRQTRALTRRLTVVAVAVVLVAAACAVLTALWARRRIQAPIEALQRATRAARGRRPRPSRPGIWARRAREPRAELQSDGIGAAAAAHRAGPVAGRAGARGARADP